MAKIILVSQKLTPTAQRLAMSLHHQQHQVTILTSAEEDASLHEAITLLRPFKRWSLREAIRLSPILLMMRPQIVHLLLEEDKLSTAEMFISAMAKTIRHCVLSTSILHIRQGLRRRNPARLLLQESDIITCSTLDSLGALRGLNVRHRRQGRGLLPPALNFLDDQDGNSKTQVGAELQKNLDQKKYLVLPFTESEFQETHPYFRRLKLLASYRHVVLLGSFSHWSLRSRKKFQAWMARHSLSESWTLSGSLALGDQQKLLKNAEAIVLAGLHFSPHETTEFFLRAIQAGTRIIMDDRQSMIHSDLWRSGETCWILKFENIPHGLETILAKETLPQLQALPSSVNLNRDLIDGPLNELNRLYNKALSQKQNI